MFEVDQKIDLPGWREDYCACFCSAVAGQSIRGSLAEPSVLVGDFRIGVRKLIVPSSYIWYNKTVEFSDRRYPYGHLLQ